MSSSDGNPILSRSLVLLEVLATASKGMRFSEIRRIFPDVPPSTISRLLKAMGTEELIEKGDTEVVYQLGGRARSLGALLVGSKDKATCMAQLVKRLSDACGESSAFFDYDFNEKVNRLLCKTEPPEAFHYTDVGGINRNFHTHGFSKVTLAFLPEKEQELLMKRCGVVSAEESTELRNELGEILENEICVTLVDDKTDVSRVAAPVFDSKGEFFGVVGISFPQTAGRMDNIEFYKKKMKEIVK